MCRYGYRITPDGRCMQCFSPELGAIHCRTNCKEDECWYSTVNDFGIPSDGDEFIDDPIDGDD